MSITYSGIVGYGKATLPSVDMYGTDMNIIRDPPKSITTRRIDRIQDTQLLNEMVDEAGDRVCESIKVYGRGINPFVRVSYDNYGNNGGQGVNGAGGKQAYPPYRLGPDGAFRPPIVPPQNLLPLSRLPRTLTFQDTNPERVDFTKKLTTAQEPDKTAGVRKSDMILRASVGSSIQGGDKTSTTVINPTKQIKMSLPIEWHLNQGSSFTEKQLNNTSVSTEQYTRDIRQFETNARPSRNISITPIEELLGTNIRTKENFNIDYQTPAKGYEYFDMNHNEFELNRNLPVYEARTNINDNTRHVTPIETVYMREQQLNRPATSCYSNQGSTSTQTYDTISNRNYNLKPTINPGGMNIGGTMPSQERVQSQVQLNSSKLARNKFIMEMQMRR